MTRMQKIVLLLTFWFSPGHEKKGEEWAKFTSDIQMDEEEVLHIIGRVVANTDTNWPDWAALEEFKSDMQKALKI